MIFGKGDGSGWGGRLTDGDEEDSGADEEDTDPEFGGDFFAKEKACGEKDEGASEGFEREELAELAGGEETEPEKETGRHDGDASGEDEGGAGSGADPEVAHGLFKAELASDIAEFAGGENGEDWASHWVFSVSAAEEALRITPARTRAIPDQRSGEIFSPSQVQQPRGMMAWVRPLRL